MDGQIYGAASAAADCFKALIPFFLFAAIRNRMWSQAAAAMVVWVVVVAYSMTSALGHAALNRLDTTGQRAVEAAVYKDLRADSKRAQEQLTWIPAHRPADTVAAELNVLKAQRYWVRDQGVHAAQRQETARLLPAVPQAQRRACLRPAVAEARGAHRRDRRQALAKTAGGTVMAEADPQASVLAKLLGIDISTVQTALTIFVALLIEIGSGFGMYVAFAYWRLHDQQSRAGACRPPRRPRLPRQPSPPPMSSLRSCRPPCLRSQPRPRRTRCRPRSHRHRCAALGANDNRCHAWRTRQRRAALLPRKGGWTAEGASLTAQDLYEDYCDWCEQQEKVPFAHPGYHARSRSSASERRRIGGACATSASHSDPRSSTRRTRSCRSLYPEQHTPKGKLKKGPLRAALFLLGAPLSPSLRG